MIMSPVNNRNTINCPKCPRQFAREFDRNRHIKEQHEKYRPFSCTQCDRKFARSSQLKTHKLRHDQGSKNAKFTCVKCQKQFTSNSNLTRHLQTHGTSTLYSCTICKKSFTRSDSLKWHLIRTHGHGDKNLQKKEPIDHIREFLQSTYPEVIGKQQEFYNTEIESDVDSISSTSQTIYFQSFLNHDLIFELSDNFQLKIKPKDWASAFIQRDLKSTTQKLQESCAYGILEKRGTVLNQFIGIAAVWMMSKFTQQIDPWSFPTSFEQIFKLPYPTNEEVSIIEQALKENGPSISNLLKDNFWELGLPPEDSESLQLNKYDQVFNKCIDYLKSKNCKLINNAQITSSLTLATFPDNADQFVDAVEFSMLRWKQASKESTVAKIAGKLSSSHIRLDFFKKRPFEKISDLCTVKRLAIYRGAKYLHVNLKKHGIDYPTYKEGFNSQKPEYNYYPTVEECDLIDQEIELNAIAILARCEALCLRKSTSLINERPTFSEIHYNQLNLELISGGRDPNLRKNSSVILLQMPDLSDPRQAFSKSTWDDAVSSYVNTGPSAAVQLLLSKLFTEQELLDSTYSGRNKTLKFDEKRMKMLFDAMRYFIENVERNKVDKLGTWSPSVKEMVCKLVVEGSSYIRRKLKYNKNP